jgi:hypothetical protein
LSITHHTRKRPSTGPRTTHGPHLLGNLSLKGIESKRPQSKGIADLGLLGHQLEQLKKPTNRGRFKGVLMAKSPAKEAHGRHMWHPTRIPQEINLKTPPRKSQERAQKIAKEKNGRDNTRLWGTTPNHLYIPWRFIQGLACHLVIHPSL